MEKRGSDASVGSYKMASLGSSRWAPGVCTNFQMKAPLDCTNRQAEWAPYLHYKKYYCIVFAFVPVILTSKWDGHGQILGMHHHHACWINWWSMTTFTDRYMKKQLTESEMQVSSNCLKEGEE